MSKDASKPISRKSDIVVQDYGNEILIYDLIINKAFSLNETSALVWQLCDGTKTVSEISNQISRQLNSPVNEDFVWLALEQLKRENLIENKSELAMPFEGLSRRDAIRKVGFATLVALPVIASLIAPMAAHAQSGCGPTNRPVGCVCNNSGNCNSNCCSSAPRTCVTPNTEPNGSTCAGACECLTNCCGFGFVCVATGLKPAGSQCRAGCECSSGTCSGSPQTCQP
jgi:hypothetical protein